MFSGFFEFLLSIFSTPKDKPKPKPPIPETPPVVVEEPTNKEEDVHYSDPTLLKKKEDWFVQTVADLKRHEGFRQYAYPDPLSELGKKYKHLKWGFRPAHQILTEIGEFPYKGNPWTVGYGFTNGVTHNTSTTEVIASRRLEGEVTEHVRALDLLVKGWRDMPTYVKTVLANLAFNLGYQRLKPFRPTLDLFEKGDYKGAASRLRNTLWFKQVGARARELVERLETGKIQEQYKVI